MQLMQQLDTLRARETTHQENEDVLVYTCVTIFLLMSTLLLVILSL